MFISISFELKDGLFYVIKTYDNYRTKTFVYKNGHKYTKTYRYKNRRCRPNDKAAFKKYRNNKAYHREFYVNGYLHRRKDNITGKDKPALISDKLEYIIKIYSIEGNIHRDGDKAAIIIKNRKGFILELYYYKNGYLHRYYNKPAIIKRDNDLNIIEEYYYKFGLLYNDRGPCYIFYMFYKKCIIKCIEHFFCYDYNNKIMNQDGYIVTYDKHSKTIEHYKVCNITSASEYFFEENNISYDHLQINLLESPSTIFDKHEEYNEPIVNEAIYYKLDKIEKICL